MVLFQYYAVQVGSTFSVNGWNPKVAILLKKKPLFSVDAHLLHFFFQVIIVREPVKYCVHIQENVYCFVASETRNQLTTS